MDRLIFHVDVNNAFLSWEAVFRLRYLKETLDLRTIPSAVGGDRESRHGIILAKSTPAKKFGIRTAEPIVDALRKCPELVIVAPRSDFYRECSHAFLDILREYTDMVAPFSIDEAGVDMTEVTEAVKNPVEFAHMLRNRIRDELGFTVNIGISTNKLLAKMASDFTKPDRVHTLFPYEVPQKMWPLRVSDLMFVGASSAKKLNDLGIHTIGELAHMDFALLSAHFGKSTEWLISSANGIDDSPLSTERADNKGYSNSTTLASNITDTEAAHRVLLSLCDNTGMRLRRDNALIKVIAVSIRDGSFGKQSRQMTLTNATNITMELYEAACTVFDLMWDKVRPIRALGIHVSGVTDSDDRQFSLFDTVDYVKQEKAEKAIDELRNKFGKGAITRASLLPQKPKEE